MDGGQAAVPKNVTSVETRPRVWRLPTFGGGVPLSVRDGTVASVTRRDTPIPWGEYSESQVEDLIAAWLLRVHPGAQRVDGAGGDDGVDVMVPVDGGVHVFEIKSYNERLTGKQKTAIAKSLRTAVQNRTDMVAWTLVLPLDRSPAEERWMKKTLGSLTSVPLDWVGRTRLEVELTTHRDLLWSFAPGSVQHRALDYLSAFQQEQAHPPKNLIEAMQRGQRLRTQLGELDPYYDFDVELRANGITTALRPKDEHAPPIGFTFRLRAERGSKVEEAIESFMLYGDSLKLGAENVVDFRLEPAALNELLGLPGNPSRLAIHPNAETPNIVSTRLHAVDEHGKVLAVLPVDWINPTHGVWGGSRLRGRDRSGMLEITLLKGAGKQGEMGVHAAAVPGLLPADALPALRFLYRLATCHAVHLVNGEHTARLTIPTSARNLAIAENMLRMAEALDRIQESTGVILPLPAEWSDLDGLTTAVIDQLLREGHALWPVHEALAIPMSLPVVRAVLSQGPFPRGCVSGELEGTTELFGVKVPLPGQLRLECTDMLIADPRALDQICRSAPPLAVVNVVLVPDARTRTTLYLDPPDEEDEGG